MAELKLPQPSEKQKQFLLDEHKYVGYGGARGGGKSWAVRVKAVLLCLRYAGIKVMIVRRTYPELRENHILPLCAMLGCYGAEGERVAAYNDSLKMISFPNGSRILFRYLENDRDALRFQGSEIDVLFVDEATQQSEERMEKLRACVRGVNDFPKRIYYTCNPGGEGHAWVKRLFIDRRFKEGERPEEHSFIQALVTDNRALMEADPDYIRQLEALPPKLRAAWRYGSWEVFEGQFFEDFRITPDISAARAAGCELSEEELKKQGRWCHVIEPLDLASGPRRGWRILRSYDFGYGKPFSCAWWAVDYEGVIYRILELYGCTGTPNEGLRWTPDRQFEEIARIEREHPWLRGKQIEGVADPAIWDASRGESIADTAARCGVWFVPGDNKRIPGWMQCHYRLQFDKEGYSRMYVFSNCRAFIRTIPMMMFAGLAFSQTGTAGSHACSYRLSIEHHIPHGEACAFTLDRWVEINAAARPELRQIHQAIGFENEADFSAWINRMKAKGELRTTLRECGVTDRAEIAAFAEHALKNNNYANNVAQIGYDGLYKLFEEKL